MILVFICSFCQKKQIILDIWKKTAIFAHIIGMWKIVPAMYVNESKKV